MSKLALFGGPCAVTVPEGDMFRWPRVNREMEEAVLQVLRDCNMSGTDLTLQFEIGFAKWQGAQYALGHSSGTAALHTAMYAVGVGAGDEIICPAVTYWASCAQALSLGASVVFADIDPLTLCLDPEDFERKITPRTKAVVVVHYLAYPADMNRILAIARRHGIKVIEDVSHAHGTLYKGRKVGSFGDVAGFSLMTGKSFAIGEAGILTTDDRSIWERAVMFGHYERQNEVTTPALRDVRGLPFGGCKYRMHQMSSAVGLAQLKKFDRELAEIDQALTLFWDLLADVPGLDAHRPPKDSGSTKGAWYACHGIYQGAELGGLSISRFCEAVRAEGAFMVNPGCNAALHQHPLFQSIDVYHTGMPTNRVCAGLPLPVADGIQERVFSAPWFKHFRRDYIEQYAEAFRKVAEHYEELLPGDTHQPVAGGQWALTARKG